MSARRRGRVWRFGRAAVVLGSLAVAAAVVAVLLASRDDREVRVRKIAIDGRPSAVAVAAGLVWVTDDESHVVHVVDPERNALVGEPIEVARNPIAIAGDDRAVWVAHASGFLIRIDADTRRAGPPFDVGGSLTAVGVTQRRVWVTDLERSELVEIDPRGPRVLERLEIREGAVRVIVAGDDLWVTGQEDAVTPVDPRTKKAGRAMQVGGGPIGMAYDGGLVWVTNSDDGTVSAIDVDRSEVLDNVTVGGGPVAVAATEDLIFVANQDDATLSRIDRDDRKVAGPPIPLDTHPRGAAAGQGAVWVIGTNDNLVVRVDL